MGRRGPPPKPTVLKALEGTYRPDRAVPNEPEPALGAPPCPPHLSGAGKVAWEFFVEELLQLGVLAVRDGPALEMLCSAYAEFAQANEIVEREGLTFRGTTKSGEMLLPHPAVRIRADAWRRVHRMLVEFGLTPSARTRVSALVPQRKPQAKDKDWIRGRVGLMG